MVGNWVRFGIVLGLIVWPGAALADEDCKQRFVAAVSEGNGDAQSRILVTQTIKGQKPTVNEFIMDGRKHWVSKAIEPAAGGWTLLYSNTMYSSVDQGKSWNKISTFNEAATAKAMAQQKVDAEAATDLVCDTELVDGKLLDRVAGRYAITIGFKSKQSHVYWFDPETKLIVKSRYETKGAGFESLVTQEMLPFDNAEIPKVE